MRHLALAFAETKVRVENDLGTTTLVDVDEEAKEFLQEGKSTRKIMDILDSMYKNFRLVPSRAGTVGRNELVRLVMLSVARLKRHQQQYQHISEDVEMRRVTLQQATAGIENYNYMVTLRLKKTDYKPKGLAGIVSAGLTQTSLITLNIESKRELDPPSALGTARMLLRELVGSNSLELATLIQE
jgi:hypothetical protein